MILNLTGNPLTQELIDEGVIDPHQPLEMVRRLFQFANPPTSGELSHRVHTLVQLARSNGALEVLLDGEPAIISLLDASLRMSGITPRYSFRQWVREQGFNGETVTYPKHVGWWPNMNDQWDPVIDAYHAVVDAESHLATIAVAQHPHNPILHPPM